MGEHQKESISHTRKVAFRLCRRKHHLMYGLKVRLVKEAIQLVVGTVMHAWLESWFGAQELGGAARWIPHTAPLWDPDEFRPVDEMKLEVAFEQLAARDAFEAARLRAMVLAYHLRWRGERMHVIAVEQSFRTPLVDPDTGFEHVFSPRRLDEPHTKYARDGRIDAIVQRPIDDDSFAGFEGLEHKSRIGPLDPDDVYWTKLRSDAQCSDYHVGATALGYEISGIIYDVVCKPDIDPLLATPAEKRKYTKGEHCPRCAPVTHQKGRKGKGVAVTVTGGSVSDAPCPDCKGSGWADPPHLYANQRERDETPGEYGLRCFQVMVTEPDRYLHRRTVVRTDAELMEHLRDDWATVQEIHADKQRDHHPRNPDACFAFNRACDMHPICFGGIDPATSPLYRIGKRAPAATPAEEEI